MRPLPGRPRPRLDRCEDIAVPARLEQFADTPLSLTDAISFEVMDRLGLKQAFTFDRDFRDP